MWDGRREVPDFPPGENLVDIAVQVEVAEPVAVVGQKHVLALEYVFTALRRSPIVALVPESTKATRQSWMSLFTNWTSAPRVRMKSFEMVSS